MSLRRAVLRALRKEIEPLESKSGYYEVYIYVSDAEKYGGIVIGILEKAIEQIKEAEGEVVIGDKLDEDEDWRREAERGERQMREISAFPELKRRR